MHCAFDFLMSCVKALLSTPLLACPPRHSFILIQGDHDKVKELNKRVCNKMGFETWIPVSGQTYPRQLDFSVLSVLSCVAQSAYKMSSDIRLLASMKQVN